MMSNPQEQSETSSRLGASTVDDGRKSALQPDEGKLKQDSQSSNEDKKSKSSQNSNEDKEIDFPHNSSEGKKNNSSQNSHLDKTSHLDKESKMSYLDNEMKSSKNSNEDKEIQLSNNSNEKKEINSSQSSNDEKEICSYQNSHLDKEKKAFHVVEPSTTSRNSNTNKEIKSSGISNKDTEMKSENSNEDSKIQSSYSSSSDVSEPTSPKKAHTQPYKKSQKAKSQAISGPQNEATSSNKYSQGKTLTSHKPSKYHSTASISFLPRSSKATDKPYDWQIMHIGFDFHNWPVAILRGSGAWRKMDSKDLRRQVERLSYPKRSFSPDHRFDSWVNIFQKYWEIQGGQKGQGRHSANTPKGKNSNEVQSDKKSENQSRRGEKENKEKNQHRRNGEYDKKDSKMSRLLGRPQTTTPNVHPLDRDVKRWESDSSRSPNRQTFLKPSVDQGDRGQNLPAIDKDQVHGGCEKNIPGLKRSYSGLRTPSQHEMDLIVHRLTRQTSAFRAKTSPCPN